MKKSLLLFFGLFVANLLVAQGTAANRCANFRLGQNLSNWLEAYWQTNYPTPDGYTKTSLQKMKDAGIQSLRLPVCFAKVTDTVAPYNVDTTHLLFTRIDSVINWADELGMNVIIDNHHLWDNITNNAWRTQEQRFSHMWAVVAKRYAYLNPEQYTFELWNEPTISFASDSLKILFNEAIDSIRQYAPNHTIIVSPNVGSSGLAYAPSYTPFSDTNLIYTWHFYDPLDFTHQGFSWGNFPNTVETFPNSSDPFAGMMATSLNNVKTWIAANQKPLILGEFGVGTFANDTSRCNWISMIGAYIDSNHIPAFYWDWGIDFSMFRSNIISADSIIPCFKSALHYYPDYSGINTITQTTLQVYPNPVSSGEILLQITTIKDFDYRLFDNTGRLMAKGSKQNGSIHLNLNIGLYILQLSSSTGTVTQKLIVE